MKKKLLIALLLLTASLGLLSKSFSYTNASVECPLTLAIVPPELGLISLVPYIDNQGEPAPLTPVVLTRAAGSPGVLTGSLVVSNRLDSEIIIESLRAEIDGSAAVCNAGNLRIQAGGHAAVSLMFKGEPKESSVLTYTLTANWENGQAAIEGEMPIDATLISPLDPDSSGEAEEDSEAPGAALFAEDAEDEPVPTENAGDGPVPSEAA